MNKEKQPFSIIYRPKTFEEVVGNEAIKNSLENKIKKAANHVYLLSGERGCGKTTLARICANMLNSDDIREYNISDVGLKDFARKLNFSVGFKSWSGNPIVVVLDEIQDASKGFQNALLKSLEDTPDYYYWFLCTTNSESLLKPIKSRCSQHVVNPLDEQESELLIKTILKKEDRRLKSEVIQAIVNNTEGIPREIVILLEDVLDMDDDELRLEKINSIKQNPESEAKELFKALLSGKWASINKVLNGLKKSDAEKYRRYLLICYSNKIGWAKSVEQVEALTSQSQYFEDDFFDSGFCGLQRSCFDAWSMTNK